MQRVDTFSVFCQWVQEFKLVFGGQLCSLALISEEKFLYVNGFLVVIVTYFNSERTVFLTPPQFVWIASALVGAKSCDTVVFLSEIVARKNGPIMDGLVYFTPPKMLSVLLD